MANRYFFALIIVFLISIYDLSLPNQSGQLLAIETNQTPEIIINDLILGPENFKYSNSSSLMLLDEGLAIEPDSLSGVYISQPIKAPNKFNAVVPQWVYDGSEDDQLHLELRTGNNPSKLGPWVDIHVAYDWMLPEDEDVVGDMLAVPALDVTHEYLQFQISLNRDPDQSDPLLHELTLTFIDSTSGPSVEDLIREQKEFSNNETKASTTSRVSADSYPKPEVISRDLWCTHPDCDYDPENLDYEPVTHLILHHTVSGSDGDSAAIVRAIWAYHTYTRGWGDIGYNFLVDIKGVIFEGHLGGDDVVGIHASGANAGSMALAMIGNYTDITPPEPMLASAVDLFSWKADQKNIDVFDASNTLPNIKWGLPNLMGHRDVYGTTQCPGDTAHALIPILRDEIASRIGLESPYIYVDELSGLFTKSDANWYVGPYQCGYNTHAWYTWSTTSPDASANWGEWRPQIPLSGRYQIEIYAPYCNTGASETEGAHYTVQSTQGTDSIIINQNDRIGLWTSLGDYNLEAGSGTVIRLDDLTQTDSNRGVWFDAIRLLPIEVQPTAALQFPLNESWLSERTVTFTWQIDNPDNANSIEFQVATDEEFQNRIANEVWATPTYTTSVTFAKDYAALYWRVIVTSESNNEHPSSVNRFGIDTQPPSSSITKLYWFERIGNYQVFWNGSDALRGIDKFNIDYRAAGEESWERWLSDTKSTSASFIPPNPLQIYEFRSQAVDKSGNIEAAHLSADINTEEAYVFDQAVLFPIISSQ